MSIKIYNTLARTKQEFTPIKKGRVGIYACGPTVYDEPHIGHARSGYIFDVIRNYLVFRGYKVKLVKNITDIDDKIIEKARAEGGDLKASTKRIAQKYLKRYYEDMDALGIGRADLEPKATSYIKKMIRLISVLIEKGYAYASKGDVYFEVKKFSKYGMLSGQDMAKIASNARIHSGQEKRDAADFALWKSAKKDEPSWRSPWGMGRPGWHIECSTMSQDILGSNFDIHGGGLDLVFPHHENEIAQSEASSGTHFANYWIHHGLLTIGSEKMAKSLGNFISIKDILKKYHPEVLKLFFLSGHYRSPLDFTHEKMEESKRSRERFYILFDRIERAKIQKKKSKASGEIERLKARFLDAMDDDFNTPLALGFLHEIVNYANKALDDNAGDINVSLYAKETLFKLGGIYGLFRDKREFSKRAQPEERIRLLIDQRNEARKNHDYKRSDEIRNELDKEGIILEDSKEGTTWRRKV